MTTTYDPHHPMYLDEADVRDELTRVFDLCHGCRRCTTLCPSFPTLFDFIDRFDDQDAGRLTPVEQDQVVAECFQCKRCSLDCPYVPEVHDRALDFPRLMLRAEAMRRANGHQPATQTITNRLMTRTRVFGALGSLATSLADTAIGAPEGSIVRKAMAKATGVSATRLLPPSAKQRFSTWFEQRSAELGRGRQGAVTIFPTCLVEYHDVQVGKDLVRVYERNGIECATTRAGCCGAPFLHSGDVTQFTKIVDKNVQVLADEIRSGGAEIIVPQPTCGHVLKNDYVAYSQPERRDDARLVAEHTVDAAEYLIGLRQADDTDLDTEFGGDVPDHITYHVACHLRAQGVGFASRDLLGLTGADVTLVQQCSGIGGMWGLRDGNEATAVPIAEQLAEQIDSTNGEVDGDVAVAGDCSLANTAIAEQTGNRPAHPISLVARAYGIDAD